MSYCPCNCKENVVLKLTTPLMQGDDIKIVQRALKKLGLYQGVIDGLYGAESVKAVLDFQGLSLLEQDGIVGKKVWLTLGKIIESEILEPITRTTKPPGSDISIEVNLYSRMLIIKSAGKAYKTYPVTIGKAANETPAGEWVIKNKYVRIDDGPLGSRWMGLNIPWGVYGIHGTNKPREIGRATSLGCIRMHNQHVEEVFEWVKPETRVKIVGPRPEIEPAPPLNPGQTGRDVQELQHRLREKDFYDGFLDGNYGTQTEIAVKEIEAIFGLEIDGVTDNNILCLLDGMADHH